jgi:hypothetical protein
MRRQAELVDMQAVTIDNAIATAEADHREAQQKYLTARHANNCDGELAAMNEMAAIGRRIETLKAGQEELKPANEQAQRVIRDGNVIREAPPPPQAPQPPGVEQMLSQMPNLSPAEKDWIRAHPDSITDRHNQLLMQAAYIETERRGIPRGSPEYFRHFEDKLGYGGAVTQNGGDRNGGYETPADDYEPDPEPAPTPRYSAPVSRSSAPGRGNENLRPGQVMLTQAREAAKASNITEVEYARQLQRMLDYKKQGHYQ